jgi:hypothetical protein
MAIPGQQTLFPLIGFQCMISTDLHESPLKDAWNIGVIHHITEQYFDHLLSDFTAMIREQSNY